MAESDLPPGIAPNLNAAMSDLSLLLRDFIRLLKLKTPNDREGHTLTIIHISITAKRTFTAHVGYGDTCVGAVVTISIPLQ